MSFVNEFIPADDLEKYGIKQIDEKFVGGSRSRQWTIDRERDIYLRNVARGEGSDPEFSSRTRWTFYWHGEPLTLRLDLLESRGQPGEPGWSHWRLIWVNGTNGLPEKLKGSKEAFLADLEEALVAYQGAGVYSSAYIGYRVTLEIDPECVL